VTEIRVAGLEHQQIFYREVALRLAQFRAAYFVDRSAIILGKKASLLTHFYDFQLTDICYESFKTHSFTPNSSVNSKIRSFCC
jgi:hypothetical protein